MKRRWLCKVSVQISPEGEEAVSELLERVLKHPAVITSDALAGTTEAAVYLPDRFDIPPRLFHEIHDGLGRLRASGLDIDSGFLDCGAIRHENWAESWKRHFKPIEVSPTLLVKPGWIRRRPRKGQKVVIIDPGLSFGTGNHPTTAFCLQQIAARRKATRGGSFLDIGTGSGILAVAAAKLCFAPVHALDFDADAVRVARANARKNRVAHRIRVQRTSLSRLPLRSRNRYDLVCANVYASLLINQRERILNRVAPGGTLVLAGMLICQFAEVRRAYLSAGMKCVATRTAMGWRSGAFAFATGKS